MHCVLSSKISRYNGCKYVQEIMAITGVHNRPLLHPSYISYKNHIIIGTPVFRMKDKHL